MSQKVNSLEEMANFIFVSKYARYNEYEKRRETWSETVHRVRDMHLKKFRKLPKADLDQIKDAFSMVERKVVVPSMRSMQFGGKAIEAANARIYNCAVRHVDSLRSFAEIFYLLLCGCGVGIGVSKFFLGRLPKLVDASDKTGTVITYVVEDTIEGWADSVEALLDCYFKNTPCTGRKIVFDYSRIRKRGTPLKTSGGKAPGYQGLKNAHLKIKALLDDIIETKKTTRMRPIHAYDILMHCADAVLSGGVRRSATSVIFDKDDEEMMNAKTNFKISKKGKFEQDEDTKKYDGYVVVDGQRLDVSLTEWEYGLVKNQGVIPWHHVCPHRKRSNNSTLLLRDKVSEKEFKDIIERTKLWGEPGFVFASHPWQMFNPCFHRDTRIATAKGLVKISDLVGKGPNVVACDRRVLPGYVVDGQKNGVSFQNASEVVLTQRNALIYEVVTEHQMSIKATSNHCFFTTSGARQLSELRVGDSLLVQPEESIVDFIERGYYCKPDQSVSKIISIKECGRDDVFCLKQPYSNSVIANGIVAGNCFEINFIPITEDGVCGTQFCNLSSINGAMIKSKEDFLAAAKAATIIGTLQAAYTEFKYLSTTAKVLTEEEGLLGVSITGMMDNPDVLLNPSIQREAAKECVRTNKEWASKLQIKQAARITCIKPEGTSSLVLMSASGIHPHHARRYFRRVQCNKIDPVYKFFKKHNPGMCEESFHSENKTDDVICFPIEVSGNVKVKDDLTALAHLDIIKNTQENWVLPGGTEANTKDITHNVSCTVIVKDNEWDDVAKYLYENRAHFAAVSLLCEMGDKIYSQAPLEKILPEDEGRWREIVSKFTAVDYRVLKEEEDNTELLQASACSGGKCELM
jgi:intein/homing endonuclease